MAGKMSKILIIGGTGYLGKFIVGASARSGHPTFVLVRDTAPSDQAKAQLLRAFKNSSVTLLKGDLNDHGSLVEAMKQVDVVISTIGPRQVLDQFKIIAAIKEIGMIKRFLPSEFGLDVDRIHTAEPASSVFALKAQIRRAIEAEGIPCTIVCCNCFAGYFLPTLAQPEPPKDKVTVLGDGNPKAVFLAEEDIGTYTIKTVDDPRTLNKILYVKPPANICSFNDLVSLWEKKTGKTLEKIYLPEEEVLKRIQEAPFPLNILMAVNYLVFVKGDTANIEIDPSFGVEASELYPDVKYTSVQEYLNRVIQ
ncbi:isoflavone reductase-like protein isoform X2 [Elaeis guineensis]|uniref:Isoflavone reductase-like protein isoform X2 n=1 Tax=Elaeis guineensis var. tenera TaxID=51953 RepID=A0A6I9QC58_ELAGV|nr:isoflavone reductase-like protein isoform X2 [Elaeis guineensis]